IGSQVLSQASSFSYTPSANSQGNQTLRLSIGKDAGGGVLDTSKPYTQKTFSILVQNTVPAVAPNLARLSDEYPHSPSVDLRIETGSLVAGRPQNRRSFSRMAIVDEGFPATGLAPGRYESYDLHCDEAGTKDLTVTLSGVERQRSLRLRAIDAAG